MKSDPPMDVVFSALAHAARRKMLDLMVQTPGISVKALASHFAFSRIAAIKHLSVLESAGLTLSEKKGRTRHLYFNPIPIQQIYDRWTDQYSSFWAERLADIRTKVQSKSARRKKKHA